MSDQLTGSGLAAVADYLRGADVIQLGQPLTIGVPRFPGHPPFMYSLTSKHGERLQVVPGQAASISGASDAFAMGCHTGTHMDSLNHCAVDGCLHDGTDVLASGGQDDARGIRMDSGEAIRPVIAPGVLLDFPAMLGVQHVPDEYDITPELIEQCAALGRSRDRRRRRRPHPHGLGHAVGRPVALPRAAAAGPDGRGRALPRRARRRGHRLGHDALRTGARREPARGARDPARRVGRVHLRDPEPRRVLRRKAYRFLFTANPLRITGATGSPVNPVAIVRREGSE